MDYCKIIINRKRAATLFIFFLCGSAGVGALAYGCKSIDPFIWRWKNAGYGALAGIGIYFSFLFIAYFLLKVADCMCVVEQDEQQTEVLLNNDTNATTTASLTFDDEIFRERLIPDDNGRLLFEATDIQLYDQKSPVEINVSSQLVSTICKDYSQRKLLLVDGYTREIENMLEANPQLNRIPDSIKTIVFNYYNIQLEQEEKERGEVLGMGAAFMIFDDDLSYSSGPTTKLKKSEDDEFMGKPKYAQSKYAVCDKIFLIKQRKALANDNIIPV